MDSNLIIVLALTIGVLCLMCMGLAIIAIGVFITLDRVRRLELIDSRLENVEVYLENLSSEVNSSMGSNDPASKMYHSMDGKYHADTLDELMELMKDDPSLPDNPDDLKKFFDDMKGDDDAPDEPWNKKK